MMAMKVFHELRADIKYLPGMADQQSRSCLFVAIDRAIRWVYLEICKDKSAQCAQRFPKRLNEASSFKIRIILTDNGKEFTDRFSANGERKPTGNHPFDQTCAKFEIRHRLIKLKHSQANGMVERFNDRISDILAPTYFDSSKSLRQTLLRYAEIYNHVIPQKAIGHAPPVNALKVWSKKKPDLFRKRAISSRDLTLCSCYEVTSLISSYDRTNYVLPTQYFRTLVNRSFL